MQQEVKWKLPTIRYQYRSSMVAKGCMFWVMYSSVVLLEYLWLDFQLWLPCAGCWQRICKLRIVFHSLLVAFSSPVEFFLGVRGGGGGEGGGYVAWGYGPPKFVSFWPPGSAWAGARVQPCVAMTTVLQSDHCRWSCLPVAFVLCKFCNWTLSMYGLIVNPRRCTCAVRVTVLGLCVCVSVCVSVTQHLTFHVIICATNGTNLSGGWRSKILSDFLWKGFIAKLERFLFVRHMATR